MYKYIKKFNLIDDIITHNIMHAYLHCFDSNNLFLQLGVDR